MHSHHFSLFGHTLITNEDFSHSLQAPPCDHRTEYSTPHRSNDAVRTTTVDCQAAGVLEFYIVRQQQAPDFQNGEQIFPPQQVASDGPASLFIYKSANAIRVVYLDFAVYDIVDQQIFCYPNPQTSTRQLHLNFLGPVMSMWLEQQDFKVLHACAVLINRKAALFLADSGQGKSTMAATLVNKGFPLLSDDLVPVKYNKSDDQFYVYPAYPVIKLWPAQFDLLFKDHNPAPYLDKDLKKCRVRVDQMNPLLFFNRPVPLSITYHLQRRDETRHFSVRPLSRVDAMTKFIRYSFAAPIMIAMQWQPQRLKSFSRLCLTHKNTRELNCPSDISQLDSLTEQIISDFIANS